MADTRVPIDPQAAFNAVSAENEWRRNRILLLENEVVRLSRKVAELEETGKPATKAKETK